MNMRSIIGAPWAVPCDPPHTFECWELVRYVRAQQAIQTPSVIDRASRRPTHRKHLVHPPEGWHRLAGPVPYCVVRIGSKHVGVFIPPASVIHAEHAAGVRIDRLEFLHDTTFWEFKKCPP